jgi:predicted SprT family Zn-dependent metalloprotease
MIEKVRARMVEVQDKLQKMGYPKFPLDISVDKLKRGVAGVAKMNAGKIIISVDYLKEFPEQVLTRTVAHEVCHHYVSKYIPQAKQFHGPEFRSLMKGLGVDHSTRHSMKLSGSEVRRKTVKRWVYVTPTGKFCYLTKQQHEKMSSGVAKYTMKGEYLSYINTIKEFKQY